MARIETAPEVVDDFERFFEHLAGLEVRDVAGRLAEIVQAIDVLATSPLIGPSAKGGKRELVIGRGSRGYVALYRYMAEVDTVFLLAVRSQREAGYGRES
ncbi:MAG: type II toxin-antitoxin system RelE/ParE family toxin [Steroidobacteraceae bacterium]